MKKIYTNLQILAFVLLFMSCADEKNTTVETEQPAEISQLGMQANTYGDGLKDVSPFPIGNVWSGGHPTWGKNRGTDLGGPGDDFSENAYGNLSTVNHKQLDIAKEHSILLNEFNSITPEMALKMHNISITPDSLDFSEADAMMKFAVENDLRIHGHVLLFDKSVPQWALDYRKENKWTQEQWSSWLEDYVEKVVGRYKGQIASWDVANEVVESSSIKKDYFWNIVAGDDVLERVFKQVESIDPNAKLFLNDNFQEMQPSKNKAVVDLANELRAKGCKIDGIGYQNHIVLAAGQGDYWPNRLAYEKAAKEGYLVHVSELDISVNLVGLTWYQTYSQHRAQRRAYNEIARAYLDAVPDKQRFGITIWNIADQNSYLNLLQIFDKIKLWSFADDYPLLWDKKYQPKPAYYGFKNGVQGIWEGWIYPPIYSTSQPRTGAQVAQKTTTRAMNQDSEELETIELFKANDAVKDYLSTYGNVSPESVDYILEQSKASLKKELK